VPRLRLLTHRHLPLLLAAIAVTLLLPSLGVGFQLDDHFLRLALADPPIDPHWSRTPVDLFAFFKDESLVRYARETGAAPWWTPAAGTSTASGARPRRSTSVPLNPPWM